MTYTSAALGTVPVLDDVSLSVAPGEFVALVGPSGSGKSTILKLVAGLAEASAGQVLIDGKRVTEPPAGVGFMFQRDALLPWATVADNIRVGLELSGMPAASQDARIEQLVSLVGLAGFAHHYPSSLSGGMRQRVSLARTLAYAPDLYLMDEPFGALDAMTKIAMGKELLRIWQEDRRAVLFVTHDIEEAVSLADRVVVLSARPGRIAAQFQVDLERPRDSRAIRATPAFRDLADAIWQALEGHSA